MLEVGCLEYEQPIAMPKKLLLDLYRCAQVKSLDARAIADQTVSGFTLMTRAGQAAFSSIQKRWPTIKKMHVFCGGGNNAGDGYIIAALAAEASWQVQIHCLQAPDKLKGDAHKAYELAKQHSLNIGAFDPHQNIESLDNQHDTIIVDALLGIGLKGNIRGSYPSAIELINTLSVPVFSVDIPSGVCGDTGAILGDAVRADMTMSFIGLKKGLFTGSATEYCGDVLYDDLGVEPEIFATETPSCQILEFSTPLLSKRPRNSHKGMFGHVLVVGGDDGYGGAGILSAESALLTGAGMVTLATKPEHIAASLTRRPEVMVKGIHSKEDLQPLLDSADIIVLGPGLGQSSWSHAMFEQCCEVNKHMVIDADGLNLLSTNQHDYAPRQSWILTPHPGEAARLLNTSTSAVQTNRFAAVKELQQRYGGTCVLKGAGSLIAYTTANTKPFSEKQSHSNCNIRVCSAGNPAMASPGMGDVLAGLIGSLLAQGLSHHLAAEMSVWAHANAGDICAEKLGRHILASELNQTLRSMW